MTDPTTGGSRVTTAPSSVESNELGAYIEPSSDFALTADEAQIEYETPDVDASKMSDVAKQLLQLEIAPNSTESEPASVVQEAKPESVETEPVYEPLPVDPTYLNLSEDFGVPDLAVDVTDPEFADFAAKMQKFLGHDFETYQQQRKSLQEANKLRKELETQKVQTNIERQEAYIKGKWKVDDAEYKTRMEKVVQVFAQLDPATQKLLDRDPNGALKLWKDIQATESVAPVVPKYEKSSPSTVTASAGSKPKFTRSQINKLSPEEKSRLWGQINAASQQGLVDWNR